MNFRPLSEMISQELRPIRRLKPLEGLQQRAPKKCVSISCRGFLESELFRGCERSQCEACAWAMIAPMLSSAWNSAGEIVPAFIRTKPSMAF